MDAHIAQRVNNISIYGEKKLRRRPSNHSEANGPSELNLFHWIGFSSPIALIIVSLLNIQCILDYLPYKYQIFPCGVWVQ